MKYTEEEKKAVENIKEILSFNLRNPFLDDEADNIEILLNLLEKQQKEIKELKEDIEEFGDIDMYAFFEKIDGYTFLTNYDFISEEKPLTVKEFKEGTVVQIMKASKILEILEDQNKII